MHDYDAVSRPSVASHTLMVGVFGGFGALLCTIAHTLLSIEIVPWWVASGAGGIVGGSIGLLIEWMEVRIPSGLKKRTKAQP